MTTTKTTTPLIKVIVAGLVFVGSVLGTDVYIKSIVTQMIQDEFRYHYGSVLFYGQKGDLKKVWSHYLHAATWAQRYEVITRRGGKR